MALIKNTSSGSSAYNQYLFEQATKPKASAALSGSGSSAYNQYLINTAPKPKSYDYLNGSGSSAYNEYLLSLPKVPPKNDGGGGGGGAAVAQVPASTSPVTTAAPSGAASSGYDLSEYIRQQQAAALEAELAGLKSAYVQSLAAYNAALDKLPQTYDVARNSVAGQNALARQGFDERAAASGLSSGAAAQAELARDSVYRGTLAGIDREQANAASEIELTKAKLQSQYESAIAQAKAGGDASLANALYQELVRVQGLNRDDEQRAQNIALQYGLKNGVSLGDVANIRSIADLANLTYYGSNGKVSGSDYTADDTTDDVSDETPAKKAVEREIRLTEGSNAASNYYSIMDMVNNAVSAGDASSAKRILWDAYQNGLIPFNVYIAQMKPFHH